MTYTTCISSRPLDLHPASDVAEDDGIIAMTPTLASRLNSHIARCAAIAATVSLAPSSTDAAIVWSGVVNVNIPSNVAGVYLNVITGATGSSAGQVPGWTINPWGS